MSKDLVVIDPKVIAKTMVDKFEFDFDQLRENECDGWSDAIIDAMQYLYDIETKVYEQMKSIYLGSGK